MDEWTLSLRLGLAALLGAVLGVERELRGQAAGLRTHILVSLGSCGFTLCSLYVESSLHDGQPPGTNADVSRIASQVVVGIGFLGAGVILRYNGQVRGLTTAANLWLTSSVGMAAGLGFHLGATTTVVISLLSLVGLRPVERAIHRYRKRHGMVDDKDIASSHSGDDSTHDSRKGA